MNICLVNGSPKRSGSTSGRILSALEARLGEGHDISRCESSSAGPQELLEAARGCRAFVLAFPLYVDGIPAHLLRLLEAVEPRMRELAPEARMYVLINNGFFEARQNRHALDMARCFCLRAGLAWGRGAGIGGGGMVGVAPAGAGPMKDLGRALDAMAGSILSHASGEDILSHPNFPRRLYILAAHAGWRSLAKKNGVSGRALRGESARMP